MGDNVRRECRIRSLVDVPTGSWSSPVRVEGLDIEVDYLGRNRKLGYVYMRESEREALKNPKP